MLITSVQTHATIQQNYGDNCREEAITRFDRTSSSKVKDGCTRKFLKGTIIVGRGERI